MSTLYGKRVMVTGGRGMLGASVMTLLADLGAEPVSVSRSTEHDLCNADTAHEAIYIHEPQIIIHCAADVGGIGANMEHPGRFFYANMAMGLNMIDAARQIGVDRFVMVGTTCAYPADAATPIKEADLWSGYPEPTNAPYGIAKRSLAVMLDAYRREYGLNSAYVVPANLYGPRDNFDPRSSHVIPAMIRKCIEARESGLTRVNLWGTGNATREFLYVDDAARGVVAAAERIDDPDPINIGTGESISIRDLFYEVARECGYNGGGVFDESMPDGQLRRQLDVSKAADLLGWRSSVELCDGLRRTVEWYESNRAEAVQ